MKRLHVRLVGLLGGVVAAIVVLFAGIWLGGHPSDLPSPLRGGLFESRRNQMVTEQALNILTTRYYRPLNRPALVDVGLSSMVDSLEDPLLALPRSSLLPGARRAVRARTGQDWDQRGP